MKKSKTKQSATCRHPDRDEPKLMCGRPLPCRYHTVTVELDKDPPTVTIPLTSDAIKIIDKIGVVGEALIESLPKKK